MGVSDETSAIIADEVFSMMAAPARGVALLRTRPGVRMETEIALGLCEARLDGAAEDLIAASRCVCARRLKA